MNEEVKNFLLAGHTEEEKIQINQQIFQAYKNKWRRYDIKVNCENGRKVLYTIYNGQIVGGSM